jgi:hypothetical protein
MSFTCGNHGWRHGCNPCPICHPEIKPVQNLVPELKAEDIVKPLSVLDDISPEELKYYATPYYDELQEQKALRAQQIKDGALDG